jgi:hypothetical protein
MPMNKSQKKKNTYFPCTSSLASVAQYSDNVDDNTDDSFSVINKSYWAAHALQTNNNYTFYVEYYNPLPDYLLSDNKLKLQVRTSLAGCVIFLSSCRY